MTVRLPATPASAAVARQKIAADLAQAAITPDVVDDVILIATELVSNAIRHAAPLPDGAVTVAWEPNPAGTSVLVRVTDGGAPGSPHRRQASDRDTSGRGLTLVHALAKRWGVEDGQDTTTVWAEV
jgi:two-component sensor histidine kinase